ncbi:hypothetical protein [Streptosporangium sp. NPDC049644]|uniref:hypothetical protein n=1 Tax=Streptosporangium sp. NPDC049644 TaxID=3155507 RepID=UPI0034202B96
MRIDVHPDLPHATRPVSVSVHKEPLWTDYGVLESYEPGGDDGDPFEDGLLDLLHKNELVAAIPGHLMVAVHPDYRVCVTTETYRRRPPVETRVGTTSSRSVTAADRLGPSARRFTIHTAA